MPYLVGRSIARQLPQPRSDCDENLSECKVDPPTLSQHATHLLLTSELNGSSFGVFVLSGATFL